MKIDLTRQELLDIEFSLELQYEYALQDDRPDIASRLQPLRDKIHAARMEFLGSGA